VRRWDLHVELAAGRGPLFLRLAHGIAEAIRDGRLRPGAALPGSRTLAGALRLHRNTVLAAFRELEREGWISTEPAQGTFVAHDLPQRTPARTSSAAGAPQEVGFDLPPAPTWPRAPGDLADAVPRGVLQLIGGLPDPRLAPTAELARALRRALRRPEHLGYGDPRGHRRLRDALSGMLAATRGMRHGADGLLVTRGAQMAVAATARALLAPGDLVAVEDLGYRPAWEALRSTGARLVPVPVDGSGLDVERLAAIHARQRVRAIYLTPHHHYPTTVALSPARRMALLDLAARGRLVVIEDDYDNEFHYEGRPLLPLASLDHAGVVVHVGTLSKILAPALRLGFVAAPQPVLERLVSERVRLDRQGDQVLEVAVAELIEDGELQRSVWRARRAYEARREVLVSALRDRLGGALTFSPPPGGMALWCRVALDVDADAWAAAALARGVAVQPGSAFTFDGRSAPHLRLGFARHDEDELREAVTRLAAALEPRSPRRPSTSRAPATKKAARRGRR
jgi:GntR family transcriptional regulator/MocR family aminotransferase